MPKRLDIPSLKDLLTKASASNTHRQHLVPKFYLRAWADDRGLVRVADKRTGKNYLSKPAKVARVTDFYTFDNEALKMPPLLAETVFAEVEGLAAPLIRRLVHGPVSALEPEEAAILAWFMAFQLTRGNVVRREHEEVATNMFKLHFEALDEEGLRRYVESTTELADEHEIRSIVGAVKDLLEGKLAIAPDKATSVSMAMSAAEAVGQYLLGRSWIFCTSRAPLITCDEPIVRLGAPDRSRGERGGVADSGVLTYPLSPYRVLMMLHPALAFEIGIEPMGRRGRVHEEELPFVEAYQLSREMAMNCHRWTFEHPRTRIGHNIWIPQSNPEMGAEWIRALDSRGVAADVQRTFPTTRWAAVPSSMWPSGRWWYRVPPRYPRPQLYEYRGSWDDDVNEKPRRRRRASGA